MDIERINENTLKLFITYSDIEDRGYSREEIWYNRQKGEELFWDVIGEVNTDDYFDVEGPMWIHINASEQGLEVVVTRASIPTEPEGEMFENLPEDYELSPQIREMENAIFETLGKDNNVRKITDMQFVFYDIDELIPLAKRMLQFNVASSLYRFEGKYYLHVDFSTIENMDERVNIVALIKEYLQQSNLTIHRLQEYGQEIMASNAFDKVIEYFG